MPFVPNFPSFSPVRDTCLLCPTLLFLSSLLPRHFEPTYVNALGKFLWRGPIFNMKTLRGLPREKAAVSETRQMNSSQLEPMGRYTHPYSSSYRHKAMWALQWLHLRVHWCSTLVASDPTAPIKLNGTTTDAVFARQLATRSLRAAYYSWSHSKLPYKNSSQILIKSRLTFFTPLTMPNPFVFPSRLRSRGHHDLLIP